MHKIPEVDWNESICKLTHNKYHQESYHGDIKYHMTLNTIFSVVNLETLSTLCHVESM